MANILIAAVVALAMSALVLLVWRMGLNFSRKDRFGVGRALNKRFGMRSRARYGWVRDVMYDSKIKLFRCNEVFTKKASPFSKNKSEATPTVGMIAEAPDGEDIVVETSGTEVRLAHTLKLRTDMRTDYRVRAIGSYLASHPAPHGLAVYLADGTCFACCRPDKEAADGKPYADGDYRYMSEFAYEVFQTKMRDIE